MYTRYHQAGSSSSIGRKRNVLTSQRTIFQIHETWYIRVNDWISRCISVYRKIYRGIEKFSCGFILYSCTFFYIASGEVCTWYRKDRKTGVYPPLPACSFPVLNEWPNEVILEYSLYMVLDLHPSLIFSRLPTTLRASEQTPKHITFPKLVGKFARKKGRKCIWPGLVSYSPCLYIYIYDTYTVKKEHGEKN